MAALGWVCPLAAAATAQPFPAKLVKLVVPQTPGGATDVFARKIGQALSEKWGQPVIIENRAGAGGVVGTDAVAKSAPDGYTLLVTLCAGSQAINASLYPKIPFLTDSIKDFQTVATLAVTPFPFSSPVHPDCPANSLTEFIALAKARPGALNLRRPRATARSTTCSARCSRMPPGRQHAARSLTGASLPLLPTSSADRSTRRSAASRPSCRIIRAGNVRALAISSARRVPSRRRIPTIGPDPDSPASTSTPGEEFWRPERSTPRSCARVNADVADILRTQGNDRFPRHPGRRAADYPPEEFLEILQADVVKWAKVVKDAGVTIN